MLLVYGAIRESDSMVYFFKTFFNMYGREQNSRRLLLLALLGDSLANNWHYKYGSTSASTSVLVFDAFGLASVKKLTRDMELGQQSNARNYIFLFILLYIYMTTINRCEKVEAMQDRVGMEDFELW